MPQPPSSEAPAAGATWDRWPFEWTRIEYELNSQDLHYIQDPFTPNITESWNYDTAVLADKSAKLNILGILDTIPEDKYFIEVPSAPKYGEMDSAYPLGTIKDLDKTPYFLNNNVDTPNPANPWAYFVARTVNVYRRDDKGKIKIWEIANEPTDPGPPYHFRLTPQSYLEAVQVACDVIHQIDPTAKIMLGSPSDRQAAWTLIDDKANWYKDVLDELLNGGDYAGVRQCVGIFGFHMYGKLQASADLTTNLAAKLAVARIPEKDIWLTEVGMQHPALPSGAQVIPGSIEDNVDLNCPPNDTDTGPAHACGTTDVQAAYVIEQFAMAMKGFESASLEPISKPRICANK